MENVYKRVSVPTTFVSDFAKMRFVILELFNLYGDSNFEEIYDGENTIGVIQRNMANISTWELQKETLGKSSFKWKSILNLIFCEGCEDKIKGTVNKQLVVKKNSNFSSSLSFDDCKTEGETRRRYATVILN